MSEFLNMGGYAFYVWTSFAVFMLSLIIDIVQLKLKEKSLKRNLKSLLKRKKNRRAT